MGAVQTLLWDEDWTSTTPYKPKGEPPSVFSNPPPVYKYYGNTLSPGKPMHTNPSPYSETMVDEIQSDSRFKECDHSIVVQGYMYPRVPIALPEICSSNAYVLYVDNTRINRMREVMPVPEYDMNAYADQAMAFMLPSVNEGTSVLNFAYELRELKSLDPRDAFRRIKYGSTSLKFLSDPKTREGFLKDTMRRIAGAHLQVEFGINPFLKDVVTMFDELSGIKLKMDRIKQHAFRPQIRHYKWILPHAPGEFWGKAREETVHDTIEYLKLSGDPWVHWFWGANGIREDRLGFRSKVYYTKKWVQRPVYHATCRYRYALPRFDTEWGEKLATYTESLGIRLDPSIPWNAARLSFLVDWVVDVSGFLSSFARENYPLDYTVLDFCHSLKWHSESTISALIAQDGALLNSSYSSPFPGGWDKARPIELYREVDNHYERWRHNPSLTNIVSKRATLRKAALAGSLFIANTAYLKKGRGRYLRLLPQTLRELQQIRARNVAK